MVAELASNLDSHAAREQPCTLGASYFVNKQLYFADDGDYEH